MQAIGRTTEWHEGHQKNEVIKNKINRQEQLYQLTIEAQLEKTGEEVYF